jgi:hypothetical protein
MILARWNDRIRDRAKKEKEDDHHRTRKISAMGLAIGKEWPSSAASGTVKPSACSCANISNLAIAQKSDGVVGVTRLTARLGK